jgi:hypothetical protein
VRIGTNKFKSFRSKHVCCIEKSHVESSVAWVVSFSIGAAMLIQSLD